jgi:hypothetical protein
MSATRKKKNTNSPGAISCQIIDEATYNIYRLLPRHRNRKEPENKREEKKTRTHPMLLPHEQSI